MGGQPFRIAAADVEMGGEPVQDHEESPAQQEPAPEPPAQPSTPGPTEPETPELPVEEPADDPAEETPEEPVEDVPADDPAEPEEDTPETPAPASLSTETDATQTLDLELYSEHAILIDLETNTVIAEKDPDAKIYPASMTKVMTALVACERPTTTISTGARSRSRTSLTMYNMKIRFAKFGQW